MLWLRADRVSCDTWLIRFTRDQTRPESRHMLSEISDALSAIWANAEAIAAMVTVVAAASGGAWWTWTKWTDQHLRIEPELFVWTTGGPEENDPNDRHFALFVSVANISNRRLTLNSIYIVRQDGKPASNRTNGSYQLRPSKTFKNIELPIVLEAGDQIKYVRELSEAQYDELSAVPTRVAVSHSLKASPVRVPVPRG